MRHRVNWRPWRRLPGTAGVHRQRGRGWSGPAYNPPLNLIFVGAVDWCASIQLVHPDSIKLPLAKDFTGAAGGGFGDFDSNERWQGWITAVDADSGTVRWKHRAARPILAAVTTTAGGIVISGDMRSAVSRRSHSPSRATRRRHGCYAT